MHLFKHRTLFTPLQMLLFLPDIAASVHRHASFTEKKCVRSDEKGAGVIALALLELLHVCYRGIQTSGIAAAFCCSATVDTHWIPHNS